MSPKRKQFLFCLASFALAGCAANRYKPAPIRPAETAARLESRSLSDPGLRRFMEANLGHSPSPWPTRSWNLETLTLAGLYFNPAMEIARAQVTAAKAAIVTAGARPNPELSVSPGVPSPYLFGLNLIFPIETAGKRGHRIEAAQKLSEAAELDLSSTAWKVRSQLRAELVSHLLAVRRLDLLHREERLEQRQVKLLEQRLAVGEIPRPEVDAARITLVGTRIAIHSAEGNGNETEAGLAGAIGVPANALEGMEISWSQFDHPPAAESFSAARIQGEAVLNRLDVRRALAEYGAAEANLQLEIVKQCPDFRIGPGYEFEERNNFFTVGFSIPLPILNRNEGPIAEAEGRRKEAAARFLSTQAQVIADGEKALAGYRSALAQLAEAETALIRLANTREQMSRRAVRLGEADRLALNGMDLQAAAAESAKLDALGRAQAALGALEDAVERPLAGEGFLPPGVESSPNRSAR